MAPSKLLGKREIKRMAFCESEMCAAKPGIPEESAEGREKPLYCGTAGIPLAFLFYCLC